MLCYFLREKKRGEIKGFNNFIHWLTFSDSENLATAHVCEFLWNMNCIWQAQPNMRLIKKSFMLSQDLMPLTVWDWKNCSNVSLNTINK